MDDSSTNTTTEAKNPYFSTVLKRYHGLKTITDHLSNYLFNIFYKDYKTGVKIEVFKFLRNYVHDIYQMFGRQIDGADYTLRINMIKEELAWIYLGWPDDQDAGFFRYITDIIKACRFPPPYAWLSDFEKIASDKNKSGLFNQLLESSSAEAFVDDVIEYGHYWKIDEIMGERKTKKKKH